MARRYGYMDWMRVVAIITVVGVHVVSKIINSTTTADWEWHYANAIDSALRWCVPIFFMLSGALLLTRDSNERIGEFLRKRLGKVLLPLLFWSAVYMAYNIYQLGEEYTIGQMAGLFLSDGIYYHLWFLYVITGLYLMAPFLRLLVKHMDKTMFHYFFAFWFLFSAAAPIFTRATGYEFAFAGQMFAPYIGYFLLGAYLVMHPLPKRWLPTLGILAIIGYAVTLWGTVVANTGREAGDFDAFYYEHYYPHAIFISLFVFVAFQQLGTKLKSTPLVTRISTATFGIYIIHPLIQTYLNRLFDFNETTINVWIGVPLSWIVIFILSYAVIRVMQKTPFVRRLVP